MAQEWNAGDDFRSHRPIRPGLENETDDKNRSHDQFEKREAEDDSSRSLQLTTPRHHYMRTLITMITLFALAAITSPSMAQEEGVPSEANESNEQPVEQASSEEPILIDAPEESHVAASGCVLR